MTTDVVDVEQDEQDETDALRSRIAELEADLADRALAEESLRLQLAGEVDERARLDVYVKELETRLDVEPYKGWVKEAPVSELDEQMPAQDVEPEAAEDAEPVDETADVEEAEVADEDQDAQAPDEPAADEPSAPSPY